MPVPAIEEGAGVLPGRGRIDDGFDVETFGAPDESVGGFGVTGGEEAVGEYDGGGHG
jgi:hypothetical protein